jgi:CubicO group peptidase (beta-lactamase class C family)
VIEQATGRPLEADYQERILRPLGLAHTAYHPQGDITGPHARGYLVNPDGSLVDQTAVHWGIGAEGGIVSDAADTARFLTALMQNRLLGPVAAAGMRTGDFWSVRTRQAAVAAPTGTAEPPTVIRPTCGSAATAAGSRCCCSTDALPTRPPGDLRAAQALDELYCSA